MENVYYYCYHLLLNAIMKSLHIRPRALVLLILTACGYANQVDPQTVLLHDLLHQPQFHWPLSGEMLLERLSSDPALRFFVLGHPINNTSPSIHTSTASTFDLQTHLDLYQASLSTSSAEYVSLNWRQFAPVLFQDSSTPMAILHFIEHEQPSFVSQDILLHRINVLLDLVKQPFVYMLELDQPVSLSTPSPSDPVLVRPSSEHQQFTDRMLWHLDVLDSPHTFSFDTKYHYVTEGQGVVVHVLDTGVNIDQEEIKGRAEILHVPDHLKEDCHPPGYDCQGHGTHVAALIAGRMVGVSKHARIMVTPVLNHKGSGFLSDIILALDKVAALRKDALQNGTEVMNMSIGGSKHHGLNAAVDRVTDMGFIVVVAAGNSDTDACMESPSSAKKAVTVGAHTPEGLKADFSNYGGCVDVYAPGTQIWSASNQGVSGYRYMSGTSMATPIVAGIVAMLVEQNPLIKVKEVKRILRNHAKTQRVPDPQGDGVAVVSNIQLSCTVSELTSQCNGQGVCDRESGVCQCSGNVPMSPFCLPLATISTRTTMSAEQEALHVLMAVGYMVIAIVLAALIRWLLRVLCRSVDTLTRWRRSRRQRSTRSAAPHSESERPLIVPTMVSPSRGMERRRRRSNVSDGKD
jgi:hypothetical protein